MGAVEKFDARDAFAFEHTERATGVTDVFAGKSIAHPISDAR